MRRRGTRVKEQSMPASRSVASVLLRSWETFLYTLKAGPAGGRLRRPSSAGSTADPVIFGLSKLQYRAKAL
jgi:hypothetical protein